MDTARGLPRADRPASSYPGLAGRRGEGVGEAEEARTSESLGRSRGDARSERGSAEGAPQAEAVMNLPEASPSMRL